MGDDPLDFDNLHAVRKHKDSLRLRETPGPMVVLAHSGMCTGGRIVGHVLESLPDEKSAVLFVGYQSAGTPGHAIRAAARDGDSVRLEGEQVDLSARIESIDGLSAHAGHDELLAWLGAIPAVRAMGRYHGEPKAQQALAGGRRFVLANSLSGRQVAAIRSRYRRPDTWPNSPRPALELC